jgi:hypothetical protein
MLRAIGFGILGAIAGAAIGGGAGLGGGLAYTELAGTSGFEGYSGYVVGYWLIAGGFIGFIAGAVAGARLGRGKGQKKQ